MLGDIMDQFIDWVYAQLVGFFGNFFSQMGNMGVELFEMSWVQSIVLFFSYLAWALYAVGLVVAVFECGIEYQTGRASVKDTALGERLLDEINPPWLNVLYISSVYFMVDELFREN